MNLRTTASRSYIAAMGDCHRLGRFLAAALVCSGIGLTAAPVQTEAATLLTGSFSGDAYGTYANAAAGPVASKLGKTANLPCPCNGTGGKTLTNVVNDLSAGTGGNVLEAGTITSTVFTKRTSSTANVKDTSTVAGLNLLDGRITADAIKAVALVDADKTTIVGSSTGSTFVNLKIGGNAIAANVAANTKFDLLGIGTVTLKSVTKSGDGKKKGGIKVEMLTIDVTKANTLGLPVGARIVIAHAESIFDRNVPKGIVSGSAYVALANAKIGSTLQNQIGKTAYVSFGCRGTFGETKTNDITGLDVGNVLSFDSGESTGFGGPSGTSVVAESTSTVTGLGALNGIISATTIKADAKETLKDGKRTRSTEGTKFVGLKILNQTISANVPPNTTIPLPLLGKVIVNEQIIPSSSSDSRTVVNGLHIFVTVATNVLGLPVGSEIVIAHADASVRKF